MTDEKRIKWLMRRGMKELDIMVNRYFNQCYPKATAEQQALFVQLLEQVEDPDIWSWSMGYSETPEQYAELIEQFRVYR